MSWLINAVQLEKLRKAQKNVIILDASWHLAAENRDAKAEFESSHILGAKFFNITAFNDFNNPLPNMLTLDESVIATLLGELGITNDHKIIFYDSSAVYSSCRALWMMKVFGHNPNQLYILNGGLPAWKKYGGKVDSGSEKTAAAKTYTVTYCAHLIRTLMQIKTNLHHPTEQLIDMRHPVRFAGGKEQRAGLRAGHIPGSYCFPYTTMFDSSGSFKSLEQIRKQLVGLGIDLNASIITTCGSGVTAAILDFVLDLLNHTNHSLYDGSWSEWGSDALYTGETDLSERPIETCLTG